MDEGSIEIIVKCKKCGWPNPYRMVSGSDFFDKQLRECRSRIKELEKQLSAVCYECYEEKQCDDCEDLTTAQERIEELEKQIELLMIEHEAVRGHFYDLPQPPLSRLLGVHDKTERALTGLEGDRDGMY